MRLRAMYEVRRTADSRQGESGAKPVPEPKHRWRRGVSRGWRWNVQKHQCMNQGYLFGCRKELNRSQSPHRSEEAGNDRGAKEGRKVEAGKKSNRKTNCRECLWLSQAELKSDLTNRRLVGKTRKGQTSLRQKICALVPLTGLISKASIQTAAGPTAHRTTNWRAGCEKIARPVRREGQG